MQRIDQRLVDLQHRLASGQHDEGRGGRIALPSGATGFCQLIGVREFAAARTVGADEIRVAEIASRRVQGFSLGGEYGTSATYLAEVATPGRRGFYSSFQYVTLIGGQLIGPMEGESAIVRIAQALERVVDGTAEVR